MAGFPRSACGPARKSAKVRFGTHATVRDDLPVERLDNTRVRTTAMPVHVEAPPLDVILRDGRTLRLRPPRLADARALRRFFDQLTDGSRYLRFHGMADVDAALLSTTPGSRLDERRRLRRCRAAGTWVADRRGRKLHPDRRKHRGRGGLRSHRRASGPRHRHAPAGMPCRRRRTTPGSAPSGRRCWQRTPRCWTCSRMPDSRPR